MSANVDLEDSTLSDLAVGVEAMALAVAAACVDESHLLMSAKAAALFSLPYCPLMWEGRASEKVRELVSSIFQRLRRRSTTLISEAAVTVDVERSVASSCKSVFAVEYAACSGVGDRSKDLKRLSILQAVQELGV